MIRAAYRTLRPALFALPAETAHRAVHTGLQTVQHTPIEDGLRDWLAVDDDRLAVEAFGESFPNPVGVAAGFDKNAELPAALGALGFGHVEVGGVTAAPQSGNPRPRLFRLVGDRGLVNRMGLNNDGAAAVGDRLRAAPDPGIPVGVNVALSESAGAGAGSASADYRETYQHVGDAADYVAVNVSCPNSEGVRDLQNREALEAILGTLIDAGAAPLVVKLSPDLPDLAVEEALAVVDDYGVDGVIAVNTTTDRPEELDSQARAERGGLSGDPIEDRATEAVRFVAERTDVPVIGVGGVSDAAGAYAKIRAGATLVQLYTGLVYEGPTLARDINEGLLDLLDRDGFDSVEDAVGADL